MRIESNEFLEILKETKAEKFIAIDLLPALGLSGGLMPPKSLSAIKKIAALTKKSSLEINVQLGLPLKFHNVDLTYNDTSGMGWKEKRNLETAKRKAARERLKNGGSYRTPEYVSNGNVLEISEGSTVWRFMLLDEICEPTVSYCHGVKPV